MFDVCETNKLDEAIAKWHRCEWAMSDFDEMFKHDNWMQELLDHASDILWLALLSFRLSWMGKLCSWPCASDDERSNLIGKYYSRYCESKNSKTSVILWIYFRWQASELASVRFNIRMHVCARHAARQNPHKWHKNKATDLSTGNDSHSISDLSVDMV